MALRPPGLLGLSIFLLILRRRMVISVPLSFARSILFTGRITAAAGTAWKIPGRNRLGWGKFAGGQKRRKKQFQEQSKKEKKAIAETIKKAEESVEAMNVARKSMAEESVEAMNVARKSMLKYNSSFAEGLQT